MRGIKEQLNISITEEFLKVQHLAVDLKNKDFYKKLITGSL